MAKYVIILIIIGILAWCPWLQKEDALALVDQKVGEMQAANSDLCAMSVDKDSIKKVAFGYTENVSYDCTTTDTELGIQKATNTVFITFFKTLLGMPEKTIQKNLN